MMMKCIHCGRTIKYQTVSQTECGNCWEIHRRLDEFLRHPDNREFVRNALARSDEGDRKATEITEEDLSMEFPIECERQVDEDRREYERELSRELCE